MRYLGALGISLAAVACTSTVTSTQDEIAIQGWPGATASVAATRANEHCAQYGKVAVYRGETGQQVYSFYCVDPGKRR